MPDVDPHPEHADLVARRYRAVAVGGHEVVHYSEHYACFVCRRAFKHPEVCDRNDPSWEPPRSRPCPECGGPARSMGMNFKPPRREATSQWRKLELLGSRGELFHSYGARPRTLAEAKQQERARRRGR